MEEGVASVTFVKPKESGVTSTAACRVTLNLSEGEILLKKVCQELSPPFERGARHLTMYSA